MVALLVTLGMLLNLTGPPAPSFPYLRYKKIALNLQVASGYIGSDWTPGFLPQQTALHPVPSSPQHPFRIQGQGR